MLRRAEHPCHHIHHPLALPFWRLYLTSVLQYGGLWDCGGYREYSTSSPWTVWLHLASLGFRFTIHLPHLWPGWSSWGHLAQCSQPYWVYVGLVGLPGWNSMQMPEWFCDGRIATCCKVLQSVEASQDWQQFIEEPTCFLAAAGYCQIWFLFLFVLAPVARRRTYLGKV